jgi:hypothetical protein
VNSRVFHQARAFVPPLLLRFGMRVLLAAFDLGDRPAQPVTGFATVQCVLYGLVQIDVVDKSPGHAVFADQLLLNPRNLEGTHPAVTGIWCWHVLEETDYEAVAFDGFTAAIRKQPSRYALRCLAMLSVTPIFRRCYEA